MRQQKIHILLLGLSVLLGGCLAEEASIMVRALQPLDEDCKVDSNHFIGRGTLNLNASSVYLLSVVMESVIEGVDLEGAGGRLLSSQKENRVVLTEWTRQVFAYGAGGTSKHIFEESEPISGILEPNAEVQLLLPLSMVGPAAAQTLRNLLQQAEAEGAPPRTEVLVRFQIHGRLMSSGKKVETAPVDFPVSVYLGAPLPTCEEGQELAPVGPCGLHGGQDSFVPICCELDNNRECKSS